MKHLNPFVFLFIFFVSCSSIPKNQIPDRQSVRDGYFLLKESFRVERLNQIDQALIMATTAYEKFTMSDDVSGKSSAAWQMARIHLLKGNRETAEGWKNNSWRLYKESGVNQKSLGLVRQAEWFWLSDMPDSVLYYTESTEEMSEDDELQLLTWRLLSSDKNGKFNKTEVEKIEKKVLSAYDDYKDGDANNSLTISTSAYALGYVYYGQNSFQKAKDYYMIAYTLDQEIENTVGLAADLRGISFSLRKLNSLSESKGYLYRCIEIYRVIGMTKEADELMEKYKTWF